MLIWSFSRSFLLHIRACFFFSRPAFGHGRLGHPQSLEYLVKLKAWWLLVRFLKICSECGVFFVLLEFTVLCCLSCPVSRILGGKVLPQQHPIRNKIALIMYNFVLHFYICFLIQYIKTNNNQLKQCWLGGKVKFCFLNSCLCKVCDKLEDYVNIKVSSFRHGERVGRRVKKKLN